MPLNSGFNQDKRGDSNQHHIARGMRGETTTITYASETVQNADNSWNGKLYGLLLDVEELGAVTVSSIQIFPRDATNDEARVLNITGKTLADNTVHYLDILQENTANQPVVMFGHMNIKITLSGEGTGDITVVPILGRH